MPDDASPESSKRYGFTSIFRVLSYLRDNTLRFIAAIVLIILMAYTNAIIPVLIKNAIDLGISQGSTRTAIYYSLLILGAGILNGVFSFTGRILLVKASQEAVYRLRLDAFRAVQRQSMEFFNKTLVGQLISRITNDAERITGFLSFRLRMLVYSSFLIGISVYYMLGMSTSLTLIALATIAIVMTINALYAMKVRPVYDKVRHQTGSVAAVSTGLIAGIKTVKSLAVEDSLFARFQDENKKLYEYSVEATRITSLYGNLPFLVMGASMTGILLIGGRAIIGGGLTVGVLVAFLTYMLTMTWPLRALGFIIGDMQRTVAAAARLFDIIDSAPSQLDPEDALDLPSPRGDVRVEHVSFSYRGGKKVLDDVSLHVPPGEKVLITGPPGSGKSTLLKLIARLYEPDSGRILIDGVDLRRIMNSTLRRIIAYVPQEPFIFNRSIRENIALAKPDASLEEIVRAAKISKIHDFIASLPNGYDTIVGEKGVTLSGGQRQRIALARALLLDPKILLLDDPVSNLDAETEKMLVEDLIDIAKDRTVIVVSQRPSLRVLADKIIVMVDGRIVEEGTHDELLERRGHYWSILASHGEIQ
ncbi:MAG: ABC transporter ATP-binding protein/permease [Desulfurococcales archaeon]|nr:ABC transporter ATP-binding protein/permease [Desulfurococcales archaeon]